jgi:hypothetical protein
LALVAVKALASNLLDPTPTDEPDQQKLTNRRRRSPALVPQR